MKGLDKLPKQTRLAVVHWQPQLLTTGQWANWGDSVVAAMAATNLETSPQAKQMLTLVSRFIVSLESWGKAPPIGPHLTIANIQRHLTTIKSDGTRRTARRELELLGRAANPDEAWPPPTPKIGRSRRKPPYTTLQTRSLIRAADSQSHQVPRRIFQVTLALGLGAGLDGRTAKLVKPADISGTAEVVVLRGIDYRPSVEIGGRFAEWLHHWKSETAADQPLVSQNQINTRISLLRADDNKTRLSLARLRTTYVANLISNNMPIDQVMALAGLSSASTLDLFFEHVKFDAVTEPLSPPSVPGTSD